MPGLSQLKKFSNDMVSLGNEVQLRASRGEKPVKVEIPDTIADIDDSEEFVLGMPINEVEPEAAPVEEDFSDITGAGASSNSQSAKQSSESEPEHSAAPDMSDLLNLGMGMGGGSDESGGDMPDLSMFEDEPEPEPEPEPEEVAIADMGLDALLAGAGFDEPEPEPEPEVTEDASNADDLLSDLGDLADITDIGVPEPAPAVEAEPAVEIEDIGEPEPALDAEPALDLDSPAEAEPALDADILGSDLPSFDDIDTSVLSSSPAEEPAAPDLEEIGPFEEDLPELSPVKDENEQPAASKDDFALPESFDIEDLDDLNLDDVPDMGISPVASRLPKKSKLFPPLNNDDDDPFDISAGFDDDEETNLKAGPSPVKSSAEKTETAEPDEPVSEPEEAALAPEAEDQPAAESESAPDLSLDGLDLPDFDVPVEVVDETAPEAEPAEEVEAAPEAEAEPEEAIETPIEENTADEAPADEVPAESDSTSDALPDDIFNLDDMDDMGNMAEPAPEADALPADEFNLDDMDDMANLADLGADLPDMSDTATEEAPAEEASEDAETPAEETASDSDLAESLDLPDDIDFSMSDMPDTAPEADEFAEPEAAPEADDFATPEAAEETETPAEESSTDTDLSLDGLDLPDDIDFAAEAEPAADVEAAPEADAELEEAPELSDDADLVETAVEDAPESEDTSLDEDYGTPAALTEDLNLDDMDMPSSGEDIPEAMPDFTDTVSEDDSMGLDFDSDGEGDGGLDDIDSAEPLEVFDTTGMDDISFDISDTDSQLDDFGMGGDDEFVIPGITDVESVEPASSKKKPAPVKEKPSKAKAEEPSSDLDTPDFSEAIPGEELPPNTLSDAQYKQFLKNFSEYPLNVRLAFENLVVQDEFTEDAEFEVIEKILNKAPARQVAAMLEKMLDISIPVPRDFEHRSAEEYEAYKKSLSYQLRNRIIPGFIVGCALLLVGIGIFNFTKNCIYKPLKASSLYKQGYALLQADEYPQSEIKFDEAVQYRLNRKWFFNYARGYRDHKQYQRAERMYKNILMCFRHDKEAGLEYADMELEDMVNYEKAEEIIRREVLDYHINDPDGILALGDIYLEWGTEKDPEKLELAREQYASLMQLYKPNNMYMGRMMRYFIRSDKLRQVLEIRQNFDENKEKSLPPEDWTELSGYLLDKYYGPLPASQEYLRFQIDGLRRLLLNAAHSDSENPVAIYNLSKYYVLSNEHVRIEPTLKNTLQVFNRAKSLKRRDIYKYIDTYKLLGEYYESNGEHVQAQEQFAEGISLYTKERDNAGFEGNEQIGKLYEDMGNLKYFVSADYDDALKNYMSSVELNNDSPQIRYRIGFIQYNNDNLTEALGSFMKAGDGNVKERNLMLAMANTLNLRGDDYAAEGYYSQLVRALDDEIADRQMVFPQVNEAEYEIVDTYLKAANNYGVTLHRLAKRTGNSGLNAKSIVEFQQSVRAWDALTRNQNTLLRLEGTNLAEQNIKYVTHNFSDYEPAIYTEIPKTLTNKER